MNYTYERLDNGWCLLKADGRIIGMLENISDAARLVATIADNEDDRRLAFRARQFLGSMPLLLDCPWKNVKINWELFLNAWVEYLENGREWEK